MTTEFITYEEDDVVQLACEFKLSEEHTLDLIQAFGDSRKVRLALSAVRQMIEGKDAPPNRVGMIKRLHHETDAGLMACKTALVKTDWDYNAALKYILVNPHSGWMIK